MASGIQYRLGGSSIAFLVFIAIAADLITLIPGAGTLGVAPIFWIIVSVFLYFKGFGIINARRLATSITSMVVEMVPVIQELPLLTAGVLTLIMFTRLEDKMGRKTAPTESPGPQPLNQGGVRLPEIPQEEEAAGQQPSARQPLNIDGMRKPRE